MPEISRFFGIVIAMYWESKTQHHRPHFHARYQEHDASFSTQTELGPVDTNPNPISPLST